MRDRPEVGDRVPGAEAVVATALKAFEEQEWATLVSLTDAGSLESLRAQYVVLKREMLRRLAENPMPVDELPPEFREWLAQRRQFGELAGVLSLHEAESLNAAEFLIRWAQARHPGHLVDGIAPWNPGGTLRRRVVVGSVALLPDTVAVLVREPDTGSQSALGTAALIAVLGDNRGGWALDAAQGWLGMVDGFV